MSIRAIVLCLLLLLALSSRAQVINELAASNGSSVENGGKFPDWIELYNQTAGTVNLGSMSLFMTNPGSSVTFTFPAVNILLNPGQFLVVWCDSDTNSPGFHTGFNLPKSSGGTLYLRTPGGGANLDQVTFGLQLTDLTVGRVPDGVGGFQLTVPTPALPNQTQPVGSQLGLRFNEWMATNSAGANKDWLELYNPDQLPVPLGGLIFAGSTNSLASKPAIPPLSFIDSNGFFRFWADGNAKDGADHLDFKLSSTSGEPNIRIYLPDRINWFENISFGPQVRDQSEGRLPDGNTNIVRFPVGRDTPGDSNFLPLTNAIINEILAHTDPPLEDAIELYNPTTDALDIGNWWLSNNRNIPFKFRIPAGTIMAPGGYKVFYEQVGSTGGFNTSGTGNDPDFTLNAAHGGEVYLFTGDSSGKLTGFRRGINFEASGHGISFGRYVNSVGDVDITAMSALSFGHDNPTSVQDFRQGTGLPNPYPKVGPVVINEVMYKPPNINVTNDNSIDEYIELHNIASTNVPLYWVDVTNRSGTFIQFTNGWKIDDAVTYQLPGAITLPVDGYLLVVNFDPQTNLTQLADFRTKYGVPPSFTRIYGPYKGKLKNSSASVKLYRPDTVQEANRPDAGFVPFVLMDKVNYGDSAPWPDMPDGNGASLQRRQGNLYGNDPANWGALTPTPGRSNVFSGTITVDGISHAGARVDIVFTAQQGQTYTVEYKNDLAAPTWNLLTNISSSATAPVHAGDLLFSPTDARFYRVSTPKLP